MRFAPVSWLASKDVRVRRALLPAESAIHFAPALPGFLQWLRGDVLAYSCAAARDLHPLPCPCACDLRFIAQERANALKASRMYMARTDGVNSERTKEKCPKWTRNLTASAESFHELPAPACLQGSDRAGVCQLVAGHRLLPAGVPVRLLFDGGLPRGSS